MPRRLLVALLAVAACAPGAPAPRARDAALYLEWATFQSREVGGDRLYLRASARTAAEAMRLLDARGLVIAEADTGAATDAAARACLGAEAGALATLPFDSAAAMALNAGRVEARVAGAWVGVVLAGRGCHATE